MRAHTRNTNELGAAVFAVVSALLFSTPAGRLLAADSHQKADSTSLMAALEKSRYRLTAEPLARRSGEETHSAVNYAQRLRAHFANHGLQLEPLDGDDVRWRWMMLSLSSYGYGNALEPVETAGVSTLQNRIEYQHRRVGADKSELTEWYVNRALGIEHGFTLSHAPQRRQEGELLHLALAVSGDLHARLASNNREIEFVVAGNAAVLRYGELHAFDAAGKELPSRLEVQNTQVSVLIDDRAALYPITIDPLIFSETKLTGGSTDSGDFFGFAVAIDGDTAVIGAPGDENDVPPRVTGSVYVYERSGRDWLEQAHLTSGDLKFSRAFGSSVALDGDTLAVGDPSGGGYTPGHGMAFVYVRNGNSWTQQASFSAYPVPWVPSAGFGTSVDVDGDTLVVGIPFQSIHPTPYQSNIFGAAAVYVRRGDSWSAQNWLYASDRAEHDAFGTSVAISGNVIAVGAPSDDFPSGAGSVYVYERDQDEWVEQFHLFASDAAFGDAFGTSVDISGATVVVGAPFDNTSAGSNVGSAYVYARDGNAWVEQAHLVASDGADNDRFGSSVAVAGETTVAVGAPFDNTAAGANAGSVHVFTRAEWRWSAQATLTASDGTGEDQFGRSVALDAGKLNTRVLVGASGRNKASGAAYVYLHSTPQAELSDASTLVENLFRAGTLTYGEAYVLSAQLNAVAESLNLGRLDAARNGLRDFVERVTTYSKSRILSPSEAQRLTDGVDWAFRLMFGKP